MFYALLSKNNDIYDAKDENEKLDDPPPQGLKDLLAKKMISDVSEKKRSIEVIKQKIRAVGRLSRIWGIRKKNQQLILSLKEMCPDGKVPFGTLIEGKKGITDKLK